LLFCVSYRDESGFGQVEDAAVLGVVLSDLPASWLRCYADINTFDTTAWRRLSGTLS
jgi:hypothetical protein